MSLHICWFKAWKSTHMCKLPSFLHTKKMGGLYGLVLGWIQPPSRYVSSCYVPQLILQEINKLFGFRWLDIWVQ